MKASTKVTQGVTRARVDARAQWCWYLLYCRIQKVKQGARENRGKERIIGQVLQGFFPIPRIPNKVIQECNIEPRHICMISNIIGNDKSQQR